MPDKRGRLQRAREEGNLTENGDKCEEDIVPLCLALQNELAHHVDNVGVGRRHVLGSFKNVSHVYSGTESLSLLWKPLRSRGGIQKQKINKTDGSHCALKKEAGKGNKQDR